MADGLFDQFKDWYENRHDYARAWKARTGGQVVATMCTYTAEELLIAAGMLPVRVLGAHEPQNVTEPHIFGMFCPFCRDSLAQGLLGRFDYCEGVTLTQSCIQYRQTFSSWRSNVPSVQWDYYVPMPNDVQSPHARKAHHAELAERREEVIVAGLGAGHEALHRPRPHDLIEEAARRRRRRSMRP